MDRRQFISVLGASLLPTVSNAELYQEELIDLQHSTLQDLILLLNHEQYAYRQGATDEILERGVREIQERKESLSWKSELAPVKTQSLETRKRLQIILRTLDIEEAKLLWAGKRFGEISKVTANENQLEYFALVNAEMGGMLDIESIQQEHIKIGHKFPKILPVQPGELFWEYIQRNKKNFLLFDEDNGWLRVDARAEDRRLAHDGALCGKLDIDEKGAMIFLMTDPGVEFAGYRVQSVDAVIRDKKVSLLHSPEQGVSDAPYIPMPKDVRPEDIAALTAHLETWGTPVIHKTIVDFSEKTQCIMGSLTLDVQPPKKGMGPEGTECYFLHCQIYDALATQGEALPNFSKRFFTSYYESKDGLRIQYPHACSQYERMPRGADFLLALPHEPTRLDIRIPDFARTNSVTRTLHYDLQENN